MLAKHPQPATIIFASFTGEEAVDLILRGIPPGVKAHLKPAV